ncbi:MAG: hypothetical protein MUC83_00725 [Pirellula sp.]|jgi:hypothetical protein|nr:hypothetical protein [Pirellula sp.]
MSRTSILGALIVLSAGFLVVGTKPTSWNQLISLSSESRLAISQPPLPDDKPIYFCKYRCSERGDWVIIDLNLGPGMSCPESVGECNVVGDELMLPPEYYPAMTAESKPVGSEKDLNNEGDYIFSPQQNLFVLTRGHSSPGSRLLPSLTLEQFVKHYPDEAAEALSSLDVVDGKPFRIKLSAVSDRMLIAQR